jgi:hypothetical protein
MDSYTSDLEEATRSATASLESAQGQIQRLLSVGLEVATDQDLIEVGYRVQLSADALSRLLTLRGYGPESRS